MRVAQSLTLTLVSSDERTMSNEACCQLCIRWPDCRAWTRSGSGRCNLKSGIWNLFPQSSQEYIFDPVDTGYVIQSHDDTVPRWTQNDFNSAVHRYDDKAVLKLIKGPPNPNPNPKGPPKHHLLRSTYSDI